ncbi:MAG TPA: ABC transporter ATP-binding protein [Ktedonobacteraceae bacterium]|nr:ABC transporter ATP-binding protein [Ktedonobacteraceae bacterium]
MPIIECTELTKTYGKSVVALNNLTLTIEQGASFGLLGENGAGKSTLVRLIMGFIFPSSGRIRVLGEEKVSRAHSRVGYAHERPIFETRFSGRSYLAYLGKLAGLWGAANSGRIGQVLEQVNLQEVADRAIGTYSKGMLQRLAIAQALMTDPELLILDEPTSGLDPRSQWEIRQIVAALRRQGKTVLLCSHYLAEVEALCDTVGILRRGEMILSGTVADLLYESANRCITLSWLLWLASKLENRTLDRGFVLHSQDVVEIVLANDQSASDVLARLGLAEQVIEAQGNLLRIAGKAQSTILSSLVDAGIGIASLNPLSRTLEDVYVQTTRAADYERSPESPASTNLTRNG